MESKKAADNGGGKAGPKEASAEQRPKRNTTQKVCVVKFDIFIKINSDLETVLIIVTLIS